VQVIETATILVGSCATLDNSPVTGSSAKNWTLAPSVSSADSPTPPTVTSTLTTVKFVVVESEKGFGEVMVAVTSSFWSR